MKIGYYSFFRSPDAGTAGGGAATETATGFDDMDFENDDAGGGGPDGNSDGNQPPGSQPPAGKAGGPPPPGDPLKTFDGDVLSEFLKDHGIENGRLIYGDKGEVHFNELPKQDQLNVLRKLNQEAAASGGPQFSGENKAFVDLLQMGRTPKDIARQILANEVNYAKMEPDDVNRADIQKLYPKWTKEQVDMELADRKKSSTYDIKTDAIRDRLTAENETVNAAALLQQNRAELAAEVEAERIDLVKAAADIKEVFGFELTDAQRNIILKPLVEVDANFQSEFLRNMQDPKEMFMYQASRMMLPQVVQYFENKLQEQEKAIREEFMGKMPSKPVSGQFSGGQAPKPAEPNGDGKQPAPAGNQQPEPGAGSAKGVDLDEEVTDWN